MAGFQTDIAAVPELLEQTAPAPEAEVAALFGLYRGPLLRFLLSMGVTAADGEELIQEVFLALFQHLRAGKPRDHLRGWLFRVAHFKALKLRRRGPAPEVEAAAVATPEEQAMENQRRRQVAAVIRAMPETDRACLALRAEGLRYREIGGVLGISLGSVAAAMARALQRIQAIDGRA